MTISDIRRVLASAMFLGLPLPVLASSTLFCQKITEQKKDANERPLTQMEESLKIVSLPNDGALLTNAKAKLYFQNGVEVKRDELWEELLSFDMCGVFEGSELPLFHCQLQPEKKNPEFRRVEGFVVVLQERTQLWAPSSTEPESRKTVEIQFNPLAGEKVLPREALRFDAKDCRRE